MPLADPMVLSVGFSCVSPFTLEDLPLTMEWAGLLAYQTASNGTTVAIPPGGLRVGTAHYRNEDPDIQNPSRLTAVGNIQVRREWDCASGQGNETQWMHHAAFSISQKEGKMLA